MGLGNEIVEHRQALAAVTCRLEQLLATIAAATEGAHESLAAYQDAKRAAGHALAVASDRFLSAQRQLRRADGLMADLERVRAVHVALSNRLNRTLAESGDSREARGHIEELLRIRRDLRRTYRRINRCRQDAKLAGESAPGPNEGPHRPAEPEPDAVSPQEGEDRL